MSFWSSGIEITNREVTLEAGTLPKQANVRFAFAPAPLEEIFIAEYVDVGVPVTYNYPSGLVPEATATRLEVDTDADITISIEVDSTPINFDVEGTTITASAGSSEYTCSHAVPLNAQIDFIIGGNPLDAHSYAIVLYGEV